MVLRYLPTEIGYGATVSPCYGASAMVLPGSQARRALGTLSPCGHTAIWGTEIGYGATRCVYCDGLWCYAMCGTDIAHGAIRRGTQEEGGRERGRGRGRGRKVSTPPNMLRACYAMSGTEIAYAATRVRVCCYALCGADVSYATKLLADHKPCSYAMMPRDMGTKHHLQKPPAREEGGGGGGGGRGRGGGGRGLKIGWAEALRYAMLCCYARVVLS
eukprot:3941126-Rhodomonas_salina.3